MAANLVTIKKRSDYLKVRGGRRYSSDAFLLEGKCRVKRDQRPTQSQPGSLTAGPRFGFTITKKIGNAVCRNRIRRRLKAAVNELLNSLAMSQDAVMGECDYVLVARRRAETKPFDELLEDLNKGVCHVNRALGVRKASGE
ncbi:MAG: ribonuclease P protein component [Pseudomonadota bacterium]